MYPYEILPGIDLYVVMLCLAAVSAIATFRILADKRGLGAKIQNLCLFNAVGAIIVGYYSAVLFQAFYNIPKYGGFRLNSSTGATFYGGLIGGAGFFLAVYFIAGHIMFRNTTDPIHNFRIITDIGGGCIAIAHAFGRIGCLMAGCCHGAETDAWYGVMMGGVKFVPLQLFEAIFLFILFGITALLSWKKDYKHNFSIYLVFYGLFRFLIEYIRGDDRGALVSGISPSQFWSLLMIAIGIGLYFFVEKVYLKKQLFKKNETALDE